MASFLNGSVHNLPNSEYLFTWCVCILTTLNKVICTVDEATNTHNWWCPLFYLKTLRRLRCNSWHWRKSPAMIFFFLLKCFGSIKNKKNTSKKKKFIYRWSVYMHEYCQNINSACSSLIYVKCTFLCVCVCVFVCVSNECLNQIFLQPMTFLLCLRSDWGFRSFLLNQIFCYENARFKKKKF